MKAILKFKLPEDQQEYNRCNKANDMASVLWSFSSNIKKSIEWEVESKKLDSFETLDLAFSKFYELLQENNINIDELYS